jgi:hypothetical protein
MERSDRRVGDSGGRIVVQGLSDGDSRPEEDGRQGEAAEPEDEPGTVRRAAGTALNMRDHRWR